MDINCYWRAEKIYIMELIGHSVQKSSSGPRNFAKNGAIPFPVEIKNYLL